MKFWNAQNSTILKIPNTDRPGTPILVNVLNVLPAAAHRCNYRLWGSKCKLGNFDSPSPLSDAIENNRLENYCN